MSSNTIVCFSINAPPLNNAEAFCTARFLSALVMQGYYVHLITIKHPQELDISIVKELLDDKIKLTILKLPIQNKFKKIYEQIKYKFFGEYSEFSSFFIQQLKTILLSYNNPILLTRGWPPISNVVGYHLRNDCFKWVGHFGDPYPGFGVYSGRTYYKKISDLIWAKKIFKSADLITVTCRNAIKHFNNILGKDYSHKMHVAYHIGYPALLYDKTRILKDKNRIEFVHVGYWSRKRYMHEIFKEFEASWFEWPNAQIVQFGRVEESNNLISSNSSNEWLSIKAKTLVSPRDASCVLANADFNIIIDQNDDIEYCPYLASKFVYAVWSGRPVIGIGQLDSEMAKLEKEYQSFYFVNIRKPNELKRLLLSLKEKNTENLIFPDEKLKELFTPKSVADRFIQRVIQL